MVADALQLLPAARATSQRWSATDWSTTRRGWLFFTSTPETRARLVPLTSLWLDTLVLRLMNQAQPTSRRTWFVIDELASLQRLPQLHTAMTEARKSNSPLVLGFQGRSQLAKRYGLDAEAMLSQPATKIFLRTSEPDAAKWISQTLGRCGNRALAAEPILRRRVGDDGSPFDQLCARAPGRAAGAAERNQRAPEPARLSEAGESGHATPRAVHHARRRDTRRWCRAPVSDALGTVRLRPPRAAADPVATNSRRSRAPQQAAHGHSSFD